jgi:hypothetical protein
MEISEEE